MSRYERMLARQHAETLGYVVESQQYYSDDFVEWAYSLPNSNGVVPQLPLECNVSTAFDDDYGYSAFSTFAYPSDDESDYLFSSSLFYYDDHHSDLSLEFQKERDAFNSKFEYSQNSQCFRLKSKHHNHLAHHEGVERLTPVSSKLDDDFDVKDFKYRPRKDTRLHSVDYSIADLLTRNLKLNTSDRKLLSRVKEKYSINILPKKLYSKLRARFGNKHVLNHQNKLIVAFGSVSQYNVSIVPPNFAVEELVVDIVEKQMCEIIPPLYTPNPFISVCHDLVTALEDLADWTELQFQRFSLPPIQLSDVLILSAISHIIDYWILLCVMFTASNSRDRPPSFRTVVSEENYISTRWIY